MRWNPSLHPRDRLGRFKPKLSQSVRVSTRSISYGAGFRSKLSPKVAVYVGALVRLERTGDGPNVAQKIADRATSKFGDSKGARVAAKLIGDRAADTGGVRITRNKLISNPTVRVSNSTRGNTARGVVADEKQRLKSNRKPRKARKPRARALVAGKGKTLPGTRVA